MTAPEKNPSIEPETETDKENPAEIQETGEPKKQPSPPPPPPPPEKPLPDDCCGSGCVRCVWDIYYDELEAYNNLYGADGSASKAS